MTCCWFGKIWWLKVLSSRAMNVRSQLTWLSFQAGFPVFKHKCLQTFQHFQVLMSLSMASLPILRIRPHTISIPHLGAYQTPTEVAWPESSENVISIDAALGPLSIRDFEAVPVIRETCYFRRCYLSVCGRRGTYWKGMLEIFGHLYIFVLDSLHVLTTSKRLIPSILVTAFSCQMTVTRSCVSNL